MPAWCALAPLGASPVVLAVAVAERPAERREAREWAASSEVSSDAAVTRAFAAAQRSARKR
jgi:hypothetical protein